jgi:hypothetical protein
MFNSVIDLTPELSMVLNGSETSGSTAASPAGLNVMVIVIVSFFSLLSRKIKWKDAKDCRNMLP